MSAIVNALSRGIAALGGPLSAGLVVVAGIVAGAIGGVGVVARQPAGAIPAGSIAVYLCPNQGPPIATVQGGQQLLVTGRLADGGWLRIHLPDPGRTEGWVEAAPLTVHGSVDSLPVATCAAEAGAPSAAAGPGESMTAIVDATPSPGPASAPPSAGATPSPTVNVGPTLANLAASATTISYDPSAYCTTAVKTTTITIKASDASGVASVALYWRIPGSSTFNQTAMTRVSGSAASGTWQASLNTTALGITAGGTLAYYTIATDAQGATTRSPSSGTGSITIRVCANTGPTITQIASSSGSSLYWDPLGVGSCQTATNITAAVKDVDGVQAVTLFFRRPGSSSWSSKPMDNQTLPGKWYANLDTLGDQIAIATPPSGSLAWYIKAVDAKNLASQTRTATTAVLRCDSPGSIRDSSSSTVVCVYTTPTTFYATASDPDGLSASSATLVYTYKTSSSGGGTVRVPMKYTDQSGSTYFYDAALLAGSNWVYITWHVETVDQYGGVTKSAAQSIKVSQAC